MCRFYAFNSKSLNDVAHVYQIVLLQYCEAVVCTSMPCAPHEAKCSIE